MTTDIVNETSNEEMKALWVSERKCWHCSHVCQLTVKEKEITLKAFQIFNIFDNNAAPKVSMSHCNNYIEHNLKGKFCTFSQC